MQTHDEKKQTASMIIRINDNEINVYQTRKNMVYLDGKKKMLDIFSRKSQNNSSIFEARKLQFYEGSNKHVRENFI